MIPSLEDRRWRFFLFSTLYLSQGLAAGFATTALANHLVAAGLSVGEVGRHLAIVGVPWVLQPLLWGPVLDAARPRAMGRYRLWLLVGIAGAETCLALLIALGDAPTLGLVSGLLLAHSTFASLMDTTTDRMIVASVPDAELGRMTAATRAGFAVGGAIGTALFAELLSRAGFAVTVGVLLLATIALLGACTFIKETPGDRLFSMLPRGGSRDRGDAMALFPRVADLLRRLAGRELATLLVFCFLIDFALTLIQVPLAARLVAEHGWEPAILSRYQAAFALFGGTVVIGAVGLAVDRLGVGRAMNIWLIAFTFIFAGLGCLALSTHAPAASLFVLGVTIVTTPSAYVILIPRAVEVVRNAPSSATLFQLVMAAFNLGDILGARAASAVYTILSLGTVLALTSVLMIGFYCLGWKYAGSRSSNADE